MKKLRVGIIGSGFGLYGLLPAFYSINNCQVVAICGKKTERLLNYSKSIGLKNIYADWQKMLKKEKLDAVAVAVPPSVQPQIAFAAMQKRFHVFAEKPLAVSFMDAKKMYAMSKEKKLTTAVDFIFPEITEWQKAKELLDKKAYGKLKYISLSWDFLSYDIKNKIASWKTNVAQGGGALSFYFSHSLYSLEHFAGEILQLKSLLSFSKESLNGAETGVDVLIKFKNGAVGQAHVNCNAKGLNKHQLTFICEKGVINLENVSDSNINFTVKTHSEKNGKELFFKKEHKVKKGEDERVDIVRKLAQRFVNSSLKRKPVFPSFKEGLRVQELIEKTRSQQL